MPGGVGTIHLPAAAMIHLASKSPRRRTLLDQIGVDYAIVDAPIDETRRAGEPPERFVERMACEKAAAGLAALGDTRAAPVLAADTVVVIEEQVLGKPRDEEHAMAMLRALSGRMHRVISAVAVAGIHVGDTGRCMTSISRVWFREITHDELRAYCASGEPPCGRLRRASGRQYRRVRSGRGEPTCGTSPVSVPRRRGRAGVTA